MSNAGIHPGLALQQARTIVFLNSLSLLVVLLIFLNLLFPVTGAPLRFLANYLLRYSTNGITWYFWRNTGYRKHI